MKNIILYSVVALFSATMAIGQVLVDRVPDGFEFDGRISSGEWDAIDPIDLTVRIPVHQRPLSQQTKIRLAYDDNYVYFSGAMYDTDPASINASNKLRDGGDESTDWFRLVIDSYNDKQNALSFFTTPTGSRWDASIQNDTRGRNALNVSWNNFWDVKTTITDQGWFAEMRIPFSSLQYQIIDDQVVMGITVWRYIARENELQIAPDIAPSYGEMGQFRPSLSRQYVFQGIKKKRPFYITPYLLGGRSQSNKLNAVGDRYESSNKWQRNIGGDIKYGLSNSFTLDLTVNTDFAQVEADDQQINLTRFSLFFPERRLFFQERSGIFDFAFGQRNNLFYSRRIGIGQGGTTIPILGGARLTGRADDIDIGLISMQTGSTEQGRSTNYSVFRVKKQVLNENSQLGLLATRSADIDGNYNGVVGVDASLRILSDGFLTLRFAQSRSKGVETKTFSLDPSLFWISLSNRLRTGLNYGVSLSRLGKDFDSNVGFIERRDYTRLGSRVQYNFFKDKDSRFFKHGIGMIGVSYWQNENDSYNSAFYRLAYDWEWKNGVAFFIGVGVRYDDITTPFNIAGRAEVPVGDYLYPGVRAEFKTAAGRDYRVVSEVMSGQFFDGYRSTFKFSPIYNVSSSFNLSGSYEYNTVSFDSRDQHFDAHIARIKALVMFSTKFSISSFIQYNSLNKLYLGNIRLRYNPREGNDLFIVYNSDFNANRDFFRPQLPVYNESSVLVKYSYTFSL